MLTADEVDERVSDELHRDAGAFVDLDLERKDRQHLVGKRLQRADAARAPRPQLRADVVDHRDPERVDRGGEPKIEVGEIDRDKDVGTRGPGQVHQPAVHRVGARQHAQDLGEPGDGDAAVVAGQLRAGRRQPLAAEPDDARARRLRLQRLGERAGIQIAGRLAARHHHGCHAEGAT